MNLYKKQQIKAQDFLPYALCFANLKVVFHPDIAVTAAEAFLTAVFWRLKRRTAVYTEMLRLRIRLCPATANSFYRADGKIECSGNCGEGHAVSPHCENDFFISFRHNVTTPFII